VTKATSGGRATLRAVTRVKPEQASKVKSWTPTRLEIRRGRADREVTDIGSSGAVGTAGRESDLGNWGNSRPSGGQAPTLSIGERLGWNSERVIVCAEQRECSGGLKSLWCLDEGRYIQRRR
jgi:hypothetical protein